MISVIDSLGGIANKTVEIEVTPPNPDFNSRISQIESFFNNSLSISYDVDQKIYGMNLAALEISQIGNYNCLVDNCSIGKGICLGNGLCSCSEGFYGLNCDLSLT
jgi:hypothetical protein